MHPSLSHDCSTSSIFQFRAMMTSVTKKDHNKLYKGMFVRLPISGCPTMDPPDSTASQWNLLIVRQNAGI